MSLLMFMMMPDGIIIVTDTMSTNMDGDPHIWTSKATPVPHLGLVVAGTGVAPLIDQWRGDVNTSMLCRDIEMLDAHTPGALRHQWAALSERENLPDNATATVYHFGQRESDGDYVGFAYRSTDDFASEQIAANGFGVKPHPDGPFERPDNLDQWTELAARIRREQNAQPKASRIHIGGELVLTALTDGAITSRKIHRFDDFELVWLCMNGVLPA